jgi:hypothetical protein
MLGPYIRPAGTIIKHNTKFSKKQSTKDLLSYDHTSQWLVQKLRTKRPRFDQNRHPRLCTSSSSLRFHPLTEVILRRLPLQLHCLLAAGLNDLLTV